MTTGRDEDKNLALFIDFDNIALGLKGSAKKFRIRLVLERLLEKGKIIIKKAYADWSHYPEYKSELHAAGIEMIEIPKRHQSGKNSADIRLAVDAMDLCWSKEHLDTFVILSGDSDFSPLVSKLRENNKAVIGIGVRESSSALLVENCDEFIFYEDLAAENVPALDALPKGKAQAFALLASTVQALIRENKDVLHGSMVKDTLKRKHPSFTESSYGYSSFSALLEDARDQGIVEIARNQKAGGTWLVTGLGSAAGGEKAAEKPAAGARRPRSRRRGSGRGAAGQGNAGPTA
ncbi:MAG TPA: NYN domain-containing protein [Candidatus Methanoperedens sp.]|nr:NYN domain-containing protein [Candidatus Methanoperedens sp.]